jgi:VanZ family protein
VGRRTLDWLLVAAWMVGLAWGSLGPAPAAVDVGDTALHVVAYLGLAWLLRRALAGRGPLWGVVMPGVLAWTFGLCLEVLQGFSTHRSFEVRDLIANAIGVGLAMLLPVRRRAGAGSG